MEAIIFDLDGTLTINQHQIFENHKYALSKINPSLTTKEISNYLGKSIQSIAAVLDLDEAAIHLYRQYYNERDEITVKQTQPIDRIVELLKYLQSKSIPMAIVTSKLRKTATRLLEHLEISQHFEVVITSEDVVSQKPAPEGIKLACNRLGVDSNPNVYYIGDTISDIQASLAASTTPIAVLWGVDGPKLISTYGNKIQMVKSVTELIEKLILEN